MLLFHLEDDSTITLAGLGNQHKDASDSEVRVGNIQVKAVGP